MKIMDRVIRKYFVEVRRALAAHRKPSSKATIGRDSLSEDRSRRRPCPRPGRHRVRCARPMVISSIGSIPRPIEGIPTKGELYHYDSWDTGEVHGLPGVFGSATC